MLCIKKTIIFIVLWTLLECTVRSPPNFVLIIADDLGWNDVGFTKKQFTSNIPETPNLDKLAGESVILDNLYTQAACTPTRASLLTGKFPHRLGELFTFSVMTSRAPGVLSGRFLSEDLSEAGYSVHGVGKWHLGEENGALPTQRGFDSFYGIYQGMGSYYSHQHIYHRFKNSRWEAVYNAYDFHHDIVEDGFSYFHDIHDAVKGVHSTDLYTDAAVNRIQEHDKSMPLFLYISYTAPHTPIQPKKQILDSRNLHIEDEERKKYAALVTHMDDGIGKIIESLKEQDMISNTVILFLSDHGAPLLTHCWDRTGGSNFPYRDGKFTFFEGGIKSAAFVWTPWLHEDVRGSHSPALLHVVDVYSAIKLLSKVGTETISGMFDNSSTSAESDGGLFLYNSLNGDHTGRETLLHNFVLPFNTTSFMYCSNTTPQPSNYYVIRHRQFKLFYGELWEWCTSHLLVLPCPELVNHDGAAVMLFNLDNDPRETQNIAEDNLDIVLEMRRMAEEYRGGASQKLVE